MEATATAPPEEQNEQELLSLARSIRRSRGGFALFFARCNLLPLRNRLVASLQDLLAPLGIHPTITELGPDTDLSLLPERLAADARDGQPVFVCGLESLMPSADPWEALAALNHRRESFHTVHAPLVIWLPEYALNEIATRAGDFWAWRSGVFCFDSDPITSDQVLTETLVGDEQELAALSADDKRSRVSLLRSLAEDYAGADPNVRRIRADVMLQLVALHFGLGEIEPALVLLEEIDQIARELPLTALEAMAHYNRGLIYVTSGRLDEALVSLQQARHLWVEVGNRKGEADVLFQLGNVYLSRGKTESARRSFQEAQEAMWATGDRVAQANIEGSLGLLEIEAGRPDQALIHLDAAILVFRESHRQVDEAGTQLNRMLALQQLGRWTEATETGEKALKVGRKLGNRRIEQSALCNLANGYLRIGDLDRAKEGFALALTLVRRGGDRFHEAQLLANLGATFVARNDVPNALAHYRQALHIARDLNMTGLQAGIYWNLSRLLAATDPPTAQAAANLLARQRAYGLDASGPRLPDLPVAPTGAHHDPEDVTQQELAILERAFLNCSTH
jgi:tetratricopeptide (TPR) repeat protein